MERKIYLAEYSRTRYVWLKERNICVKCGCEEAEPDKTLCLECAEKDRKRHSKNSKERNEKNKIRSSKSRRRLYYERKENGICTSCGKFKICRKSTVFCLDCYVKKKKQYRDRNNSILRSDRPNYGLCYTCGKRELYSASLCTECYERQSKNMKRLNVNPTPAMLDAREKYNKYSKVIFQKG